MFSAQNSQVASSAANYIEDVFSTYLYTGNGSTQTITNGIDLSGKGGMVWLKPRSESYSHKVYDTVRGVNTRLLTNTTDAGGTGYLTSFNSDGFSKNYDLGENTNGQTYVSWTFREQAKFFDVVTYTGNGVDGRTVSHSLGSTPGFIVVKRTDGVSNWVCWHRSINSGTGNGYIFLQTTAAAGNDASGVWGNGVAYVAPTSTQFTVAAGSGANANGASYVAYLFAHDAGGFGTTGSDNVISCGSYVGNSTVGNSVTLGFEPQFVLIKRSVGGTGNWKMIDMMRGFAMTSAKILDTNTSGAEDAYLGAGSWANPTATGFSLNTSEADLNITGSTYIYIAIRRGPMRTPTSGTSVFTPNVSTTTDITGETFTVGFPPDSVWPCRRNDSSKFDYDRLRGQNYLVFNTTGAENNLDAIPFDQQNSFKPTYNFYQASPGVVLYSFRRAPGFFDVVCYTGTGSNTTITHNLGATPELMIVKRRGTANAWAVYANNDNTDYLVLNTDAATVDDNTYWNDTSPTSSVFSVGTNNAVNASGSTYVAYLFASVTGVSKVGSYTGNGSNQTINCGFTAGARFVMIKRTDSTGDWYVYDTARGIVSGNDPQLKLNSTAAEATGYDAIDPDNSGFIVNNDATNFPINVNNATYIYLSIA